MEGREEEKGKPRSLCNKNTANALLLSWEIKTCGMDSVMPAIQNRRRDFNYYFPNVPIHPI
jgi:hypothetical protein